MDKHKQREAQIKAAAFMEYVKATDAEDMGKCVEDIKRLSEVDSEGAKVIAAAFRQKQLPILARNAGLNEQQITELLKPSNEHVENFADDKEEENDKPFETETEDHDDDETEDHDEHESEETPFEEAEENEFPEETGNEETEDVDDLNADDTGEVNEDDQMADITIQAPVSMIEKIQEMLSQLTGMDVENDFEADEQPFGTESEEITEPFNKEIVTEEIGEEPMTDETEFQEEANEFPVVETECDSAACPHCGRGGKRPVCPAENKENEINKQEFTPGGENAMNKETLAQRKAERAKILGKLTRTAEDIKPKDIGLGKDTSANGKPFQYSADAQPQNEMEYPTMKMEGSEGNTLKGDPSYNKISVPTKNPENLQLSDAYETFNFEGNGDGTLEWSVDFDKVDDIPSAGDTATDQKFEVPSQISLPKHKTTVARKVECMGCANSTKAEVHTVECMDCNAKICICEKCEEDGYCPSCAATVKTAKTEDKEDTEAATLDMKQDEIDDVKVSEEEDKATKEAEVFKARLKTAYAVSTQMALANVISADEVNDNVEMWMNDGMSCKSMKVQGKLFIRSASASNATQRVATASTEKYAPREVVASVNPSFVSNANYDTKLDLNQALKGIFTTVEVPNED